VIRIFHPFKEETRAVWTWIWLEQLKQDLRYAFRTLRRSPGFTATAVLTLALCIGMNTAMFSVVDAVILQPLPYPEPDRLVWISDDCSANGHHSWDDCLMSRADFVLWKKQAQSFEAMALVGNEDMALLYRGEATTERIGAIQGDFWAMLNAHAALGRLFGPSERDAIVLAWPTFQRTFSGDPTVLGKSVELEGHVFRIVGILAPTFENLVPQGLYPGDEVRDIGAYTPTIVANDLPGDPLRSTARSGPTPTWFRIVGKIRRGVSFDRAHAEMEMLFTRTWKQHPNPYSHHAKSKLRFETLSQRLTGRARPTLAILFAAVVFVLFIGTANIANLLLARASTREREIAIRAAIGAGRARILRQFLAESVLLALLGGAAGIALAGISLTIVKRVGSPALPRLEDAHIDASVLIFALSISLFTGLLFGLAPALTFVRHNLDETLRHDARGSSSSSAQLRLRGLLVAAEVALTIVLLIGAGLMLKSFKRMTAYPPGFDPGRILTVRLSLAGPQYDRQWPHQAAYLEELFHRLAKLPGILAYGIDCGRFNQSLQIVGVRPPESEPVAPVRYVTPGYLQALGMPLLGGRWPGGAQMLHEAVVNESFVRQVASGENVIGRPRPMDRSASSSVLRSAFEAMTWRFKPSSHSISTLNLRHEGPSQARFAKNCSSGRVMARAGTLPVDPHSARACSQNVSGMSSPRRTSTSGGACLNERCNFGSRVGSGTEFIRKCFQGTSDFSQQARQFLLVQRWVGFDRAVGFQSDAHLPFCAFQSGERGTQLIAGPSVQPGGIRSLAHDPPDCLNHIVPIKNDALGVISRQLHLFIAGGSGD